VSGTKREWCGGWKRWGGGRKERPNVLDGTFRQCLSGFEWMEMEEGREGGGGR